MDPYKVLQIDKNASESEIKKAYHKLARKYHPEIKMTRVAKKNLKK